MRSSIFIAIGALLTLTFPLEGQVAKSPVPDIARQLADYYNTYPKEKVFVMTDKTHYRPGESLWFRAFVTNAGNLPVQGNSQELYVKLFDKDGEAIIQEIFGVTDGLSVVDLQIPGELPADNYFLVAYTSLFHAPDRVACFPIRIDPQYSNEWIARTSLKDSLSEAGKNNILSVVLREVSGDARKNTNLRYQFMNGTEVLAKGKIKTDENGKAEIPLAIPEKTNGEPFICEIAETHGSWLQDVWVPTTLDPLQITFYPEGETRVTGTTSKIGFTAFNKWGIPVDVDGQLTDQNGKAIAMVRTFTKGLGLITLQNLANQNLKLFIPGKNQSFAVPAASETGVSLTVTKTDTAFIWANFIFPDQQKHPVSIVVSRAGNVYWAGDVEVNGSSRIKIPTENLPQGINLLSVFDPAGKLLANRILFTDKDQLLNISVKPEKQNIQAGQSMKVKVILTSETGKTIAGNVAISVSDKFRNNASCPDIEKSLLFASELETPFSLISDAFQEKISNTALLDAFLLANKIKGFSWEEILRFKPGSAADLRTLNNQVTGTVTDKTGKRVAKAKVTLLNNRNIQIYNTITDEDGRFSFAGILAPDDYTVKATDQDGKRDLNVTCGKNFDNQLSAFVKQMALKRQLQWKDKFPEANYVSSNSFLFTKAPRVNPANAQKLDNQRKMLESATSILDVIKTLKPYKIMNNMIVFAGTENSLMAQGGALIVVDGQQMGTDISAITNISPLEVDHINVSTNAMDIQRYTGLNSVGVIEIFLKRGKAPDSKEPEVQKARYEGGVRVPNTFEPGEKGNTTLLWLPDQQVDSSGSFEFTIRAGKIQSDFVITVQGMTPDGRMGSGEAVISVKK